MDVSTYLGKRIHLELINEFFYEGSCISIDDDSLVMIDRLGNRVTILIRQISFIREMR